MDGDFDWRVFHDSRLTRIEMDWTSGHLVLRAVSHRATLDLVAEATCHLVVPRSLPWGWSESINEVRGPSPIENGLWRLEVEMQSGDVILATATRFRVNSSPRCE